MSRRNLIILGTVGSIASWFISYRYLTDNVLRSSSLVQQTIFNLETNEASRELLGKDIKVVSKIKGDMNQYKGVADIEFECEGSEGKCLAKVEARRYGADWKTEHLALTANGQPFVIISKGSL